MNRKHCVLAVGVALILGTAGALGLVSEGPGGSWPTSWPKELEPLRQQARTIVFATGTHLTVYEIPFTDAGQFEKAWPHILTVKSKGTPLILEKSPSTYIGITTMTAVGGENKPALSQLYPPSNSMTAGVRIVCPWSDRGEGVLDLILVTDGKVVDLNRISLPADTPIIDRRFDK